MGQKLTQFYEEVAKIGGIKAKMRLAVLTLISSAKAVEVPDSPENITKFEKAIQEIKKELQ
jgi:hypothetical protein